MKTSYLNIHGFLTVRINQKNSFEFIKDINHPFSFFEIDYVGNPDIILNVGPFSPNTAGCSVVDHKYYIKEDYIYCSEKIEKILFEIEIKGLETFPTVINVDIQKKQIWQFLFPSLQAQNIILRSIIDFKLTQRKVLSLHSAGITDSDGAIIFLGRGGTFKTTVAMDFMRKKNCSFLGDDRVLLFGKEAYCYPIHHKLFDFRVSKMKTEDYERFDKLRYIFFSWKNSAGSKLITTKSPLKIICCMIKKAEDGVEVRRLKKDELIQKTLKSHQMENIISPTIMKFSTGKMYEYLNAYSFVFPDSIIANYWNDYATLLDEYIEGEEFLEIILPQKYSTDVVDKVFSLLKEKSFQNG